MNSSPLGNFSFFLSTAYFFQNQLFKKNYFRNTICVSNRLDPDQLIWVQTVCKSYQQTTLGDNELMFMNPGYKGTTLYFTQILIWASRQENLSSGVCEQHRRKPACTSVQSDQRLCYSLFGKYHI